MKIILDDTRESILPFKFDYLPEYNVVQVQTLMQTSAMIISRSFALEQLGNPDLPTMKRKIYQRALEILDEQSQ